MNRCRYAIDRRVVLAASLSLAIVSGHARSQARQVTQYSIEDFLATTDYGGADFSPDHTKLLVHSNESGIFNAYALPVDGGKPRPLTTSTKESIFALEYFPRDERFLYTSDVGGNELHHIHVQRPDGSVQDLTPGTDLKATFMGWAQDDRSFFLGTNERDKRYVDVYEYDPNTYQRRMIYENKEGYDFADISPDRQIIALSKVVTNADTDIYLLDRRTGTRKLLTDEAKPAQNEVQTFSPDGKYLYYLTDKDHEFMYLVRCDLRAGTVETVQRTDWDIMYAYLSHAGRYLVVGVNRDARTELRMYEMPALQPVQLPVLPDADITGVSISRDERHLAFYASSSRMPRDLFYYDLSGGKPRQLTHSLSPKIDPQDLVEGQVVRFPSYDGREIPGILYRPLPANREARRPALVLVHGGPGGQSRIGYRAEVQFLVNHGYALYAINNRGSSGYGKTFFHLDDRKHGQADLDDVVAARGMLAALDYVDGRHIGIMGGSYGGYMTLAALTFRPEAFDVGIDLFGISNWYRTLQSIPPWWESFRADLEQEMGDFNDVATLKAKSPLFHAQNIRRPLLVLQGANDPRVLKVESDEIVAAARANGVPTEYVVFDDEGHGFLKKKNQARGFQATLDFLDQYLKPAAPEKPGG
jgi:dipeptidyl aminopeptidase/acylaminoacyl peptidase